MMKTEKYKGPFGTGHLLPQVFVPEWVIQKLERETERRKRTTFPKFSKSDLLREIVIAALLAMAPDDEEEPSSRRVPTTQPPPFA